VAIRYCVPSIEAPHLLQQQGLRSHFPRKRGADRKSGAFLRLRGKSLRPPKPLGEGGCRGWGRARSLESLWLDSLTLVLYLFQTSGAAPKKGDAQLRLEL